MKVFRSSIEAQGQLKKTCLAMGNFDGVHCGHQALFRRATSLAQQEGGAAVALTFHPHPASFFNPNLAPPLLNTEEQKLSWLEQCGLDAVVIEPFDENLSRLTPQQFIGQILHQRLAARHVVVGQDFLFGRQRTGNLSTLIGLGRDYGFEAHGIETVRISSIVVSSSKLREFILLGRVGGASLLLGRDYLVEGRVVAGKARGRSIGIPTANVMPDNEIIPRKGVYAGWARPPQGEVHRAVINIGTNPTFEQAAVLSLEVHLLDFSADLYGQQLGVFFTQRLRDEQRFESVQQLLAAIHNDISEARALLQQPAISIFGS